jgi:agmatine deiminase
MPPPWAPHERTLMAWPCRRELWKARLQDAQAEYAAVANAICAFEDLTLVCATEADAAQARAAVSARAEIVVLPVDDSWLRDSGPIFTLADDGGREAVHFGFNAWGGRFEPHDADARIGGLLAAHLGDPVRDATGFVLEGGAVLMLADGSLVTTEQCLLHPSRNPDLDRSGIERALTDHLGAARVVWLAGGLVEDRDTDGHVDLVAAPLPDGRLLLQSRPAGDPDHEVLAEDHARAHAAGLDVVPFEPLTRVVVDGEEVAVAHLNLYFCNGAAIVPLAGGAEGAEADEEALAILRELLGDREVVGVPGRVLAYGGGGVHCITQQVPAARAPQRQDAAG